MPGAPERFARIAVAMGKDARNKADHAAADLAVEEIYGLTEELHIPTLQQLGFAEDEISMLAKIAFEDPQTVGNPRELDLDSYAGIYQRAFQSGR